MTWLIAISVLFAVPILVRAWLGWKLGAPAEMRHVIVHLFGVLVAVRYWQPCTETLQRLVTFEARFIAVGAFIFVYAIAAVAASLAVNIKAGVFQSVRRDYLSQVLGLLAGVFSGSIIGGVMALLLSLAMPAEVQAEEAKVPGELLHWPLRLTQSVETNFARVPPESPGKIRTPEVVIGKESEANDGEGGLELVWK